MITTVRTLKIKDFFLNNISDRKKTIWCGQNQEEVLTHKSWISLKLLFQWFEKNNQRKACVMVPSFLWQDAVSQLEDNAEFLYYNVDEKFLPNYKECIEIVKNEGKSVDFFVFVYYFGMNLDAGDAKIFCKNNNLYLIEDLTHTILGQGKEGTCGDFAIYSPMELLGLPDGGILLINSKGPNELEKEIIAREINTFQSELKEYSTRDVWYWKVKTILQKILPSRKNGYVEQEQINVDKENIYQISKFSKNKLLSADIVEILKIADKKRINKLIIDSTLKDCGFEFETVSNDKMPYADVLILSKSEKELRSKISKLGQVVLEWSDLPKIFDKTEMKLKSKLLCVAIHDCLKPKYIFKKLSENEHIDKNKNFYLKKISKAEYDEICRQYEGLIPLLQSSAYAESKKSAQGWSENYWIIKEDDEVVAFFVELNKYKIVHRINRGPQAIGNTERNIINNVIKDKFSQGLNMLFWAPEIEQSGNNMVDLLKTGFKYRESYFSTGYMDLSKDIDEIRKNLNGKWRNHLKSCEKLQPIIHKAQGKEEFNKLLEIHKEDKKTRGFKDSGDKITQKLFDEGNLEALYIKNENDEVLSFVMIATHYKTATYFIGWSNEEGYKKNVNRYLLWQTIITLKEHGYKWLDLGGIDVINTPGIADFKLGMGCKYINLVGEYFSF